MASSNSSSKIIFVTGASGFIGYHVVHQLLRDGYTVRAAARGRKADILHNLLKDEPNAEALKIPDIYSDDLSDALKGVYAVIHVAAPLPGEASAESNIKIATEGVLHLLNETTKAGINRFIVTSSANTYPIGGPYGPHDWYPLDIRAAANIQEVYGTAKTAADKTIVAYSSSHPELDVTLIGPAYTYGPFAPGFEQFTVAAGGAGIDYGAMSTNGFIYRLLKPDNVNFAVAATVIDVRDVAKAHVLALTAAPQTKGSELKRFALVAPQPTSYQDAVRIVHQERPELRGRLVDVAKVPAFPVGHLNVDRKKIEEQIGFKEDGYRSWRETVLDTVDDLVALEKYWKSKGYESKVPEGPVFV